MRASAHPLGTRSLKSQGWPRMRFKALFLTMAFTSLVACDQSRNTAGPNPEQLSREEARSLILASDKTLQPPGIFKSELSYGSCLEQFGLDLKLGAPLTKRTWEPTERTGWLYKWGDVFDFRPPHDLKFDVTITGIKPAPLSGSGESAEHKIVVFQRSYPNPQIAAIHDCVRSAESSEALLVLYDDGWRVEKVIGF